MSYAIPNRGLPSRGWVDRSIPEGPGVFVSNAEQWGGIPKRGISVGELPLYGIPSSEVAAPIVSNAEQIGAIPELGVPIGTIILRGIPVYGAEEVAAVTPTEIQAPGYTPRSSRRRDEQRYQEYISNLKGQHPIAKQVLQIHREDQELMEILAMVMQTGILD